MVSCAHLSVALRVALGASTWPGKRGFTIRRSSPTQRRNGRAFSSLTARGGGLPIGVILADTERQSYHLAFLDNDSRGYVFCDLFREVTTCITIEAMIVAMRQWQV